VAGLWCQESASTPPCGAAGEIWGRRHLFAVESEDECGCDGNGMDTGENKFLCIESP